MAALKRLAAAWEKVEHGAQQQLCLGLVYSLRQE